MLQTFRERIQGLVVTVVIALVILGLGFFGIQNFFTSPGQDVVAKVDGYRINENQLNQAYELAYQQLSQAKVKLTEPMKALLKREVLQTLIAKQVELKSAIKLGLTVSQAQIESAILSIPFFQENGTFSYSKFHQFLAANRYTEASFLNDIKQLALVSQLKAGIVASAFLLEPELSKWVAQEKQKRTFDYLILPKLKFLSKIEPDSKAIEAYYAEHQSSFKAPEKVKVDYLLLSPQEIKKRLALKDPELKKYYEENKASFGNKTFKEVESQVKQLLVSEKLQASLSAMSDQLAELTYTHPDNLLSAAKALKLEIKTSDFMTKEGGVGLFSNPAVVQAIFSPDVLTQGRNSEILRLKDGTVLALRTKQYEPSKVLPLSAVRNQIVVQLRADMQKKAMQETGEAWLAQLKKGQNIQKDLKTHRLTWQSVKAADRKKNLNPEMRHLVFEIPHVAVTPDKPSFSGKLLSNGDYALIRLHSVELGSLNQVSAKEKQALIGRLEQEMGAVDYRFYLQSIIQRAKVAYLNPASFSSP